MLKLGSPESGLSGDAAGRLNVVLTESDDEIEFSSECFVEEEKLEEIMQELYKEITSPSYNTTSQQQQQPTVTLPSPSSSSSSPLLLSTLPFFSACDVKSDSCGASMSHSSSTVMAGIAFVGLDVKVGLPEKGKMSPENDLWVTEMEFDDNNKSKNKVVGGEGEMDENDEWLARVLGWGPLELEDWS
ncbi:hypothetical protein HRI_002521000 [Hibiscus trionum]|uniref:Uncharacterized protein n=1 Tax=Hibiscus trionum TaxID=183268 RepID=A0A9W7M3N5_HIBTR|nr:hypothetical protein HRI_002521000 [Hibiscus trionum]